MTHKHILLVEDDPDSASLSQFVAKRQQLPYAVIVVGDGEEVLEYLFGTGRHAGRDITDKPGVILMDLKLPKLSGLEVLSRIREHDTTALIPVTIFSASSDPADVVESYLCGANSYISKPGDFEKFERVLHQLARYWMEVNLLPET